MPRITFRTSESDKLARLKGFLTTLQDMETHLDSDLDDFYSDEFDTAKEKITNAITDIILDADLDTVDP